jgi:hypothetical protein
VNIVITRRFGEFMGNFKGRVVQCDGIGVLKSLLKSLHRRDWDGSSWLRRSARAFTIVTRICSLSEGSCWEYQEGKDEDVLD